MLLVGIIAPRARWCKNIPCTKADMVARLVTSPNFALTHAADGACYAAGETEPYPQFWLDRREQMLFALFGQRGGMSARAAENALLRMTPRRDATSERRRIAAAIAGMAGAGLLIPPDGELSRYDRTMARDYLDHRPFPAPLARRIEALAGIGVDTPVLDLAAGPGSLALELAQTSQRVRMIELSRGFVAAAEEEAAARGVRLDAICESANRLPQHDGIYGAITISQALHWLDDVAVVKGVIKCLAEGGSFFVVHAALTLPDAHPLAHLLGDRTLLGDKQKVPFAAEVRVLFRRLELLFAALGDAQVARHDPDHARTGLAAIGPAGIDLFRQRRPIDLGFARAFLTDSHIAGLGVERPAFWSHLAARCAGASAEAMLGRQDFALLHFRRGAADFRLADWRGDTGEELAFP